MIRATGKGLRVVALLAACLCVSWTGAQSTVDRAEFSLDELTLHRDGEEYTVYSSITVPAEAGRLRRLLSSPEVLPKLNPHIESADVLVHQGPSGARVRLVSRRCVLFFCRRYEWTQSMTVVPGGDILVRFEPGSGFFSEGEIWYHIHSLSPRRSRVKVSARLVPAIALPPLIGPALMRGLLADDMRTWAVNMAAVASEI